MAIRRSQVPSRVNLRLGPADVILQLLDHEFPVADDALDQITDRDDAEKLTANDHSQVAHALGCHDCHAFLDRSVWLNAYNVERAEHYLQRFWRHLPEKGQIVAFDRSWYGRVLVERVEGVATKAEWRRAYREINEFERVLIDSGVRLVKLLLHITSDEQVRRFRDRLINPVKRWKLSYEDFRNRAKRSDYVAAIEDMLEQTTTKLAPWHLIPANNKPYSRVAAFCILVDRLGAGVSLEPRPIDPKLFKEAKLMLGLSASDIRHAAKAADRKIRLKHGRGY